MFADKLTLPLPKSIEAGLAPEPLLASARFRDIKENYDNSDKSYDDSVEAAYQTAELIRKYIEFSVHKENQPELSPEWIGKSQKTNCYGHSIIASECLEILGVEHYVGFTNLHALLIMQDRESDRVNLIDTAVKKLCVDITPALGGAALYQCNGVSSLCGSTILQRSLHDDKCKALEDLPWLSFAEADYYFFKSEEERKRVSQLVLRLYEPEQGRDVLLSFGNFIHAVERNNMPGAHQWIQGLDGSYPDLDPRNKLTAPTRLVRALGEATLTDMALDDIGIIKNSLWPTNDLDLHLWPDDERCRVGVAVKSADIIRDALKGYDETYQKHRDAGVRRLDVERRLKKMRSQLNRIAG